MCRSLCSRLTAAAVCLQRFLEPPFLRDLEMLAGGPPDGRNADSLPVPEGSPQRVPDRDAELEVEYGRLKGLLHRSDIPAPGKPPLYAAIRALVEIEREMRVADALLQRYRSEILTDAERQELCDLIRSIGSGLHAVEDSWSAGPCLVPDTDIPALPEAPAMRELQRRWRRLRDRFHSDDMPWEDSIRPIATRLPGSPGLYLSVSSCMVPGIALGTRFAGGYPAEDFGDPACLARYWHVSGLQETVLTDAGGGLLFRGLHHDIFPIDDSADEYFDRVGDDDICELVERLLFDERVDTVFGLPRELLVQGHVEALRAHETGSKPIAEAMRASARINLAGETVAAALVADPERFERALTGETVDLDLFSIAMLAPDDRMLWCEQRWALSRISEFRFDSPTRLYLRDRHGAMRTVTVHPGIRQFAICPEPGDVGLIDGNDEKRTLWKLLGPLDTPEPGGDVMAGVEAMNKRAGELRAELAGPGWRHATACPVRGAHHRSVQAIRDRLSGLEAVAGRLEKNARTLEDAGRQLKALWMREERWPAGAEQTRRVGARLALIGHLLGGMPLLSCARGRAFTRELDAEIKFLATVADHRNGRLLPLDFDGALWRQTLSDFRP